MNLDRGTLDNLLGGAFCPGGECCWIIRNQAIDSSAYRINQPPTRPGTSRYCGGITSRDAIQ